MPALGSRGRAVGMQGPCTATGIIDAVGQSGDRKRVVRGVP